MPLPRLRLVRAALPAPRSADTQPLPAVDRTTPTLRLTAVPPANATPADARRRERLPDDVQRTAERLDAALDGRRPDARLLTQLSPTTLADLTRVQAWAVAALEKDCPKSRPPRCAPNVAAGSGAPGACPTHAAALRAWWDVLHPAAWLLARGALPRSTRSPR